MKKLYSADVSDNLRMYIEKVNQNESFKPNEIITFFNKHIYDLHKKTNPIFCNQIESLFDEVSRFHDLSEDQFISSFSGNYQQRLFEIAIIKFFSSKFNMLPRQHDQKFDASFECEEIIFLIEIVTRSANQLDKFHELLPNFDLYFQAAKILNDAYQQWVSKYDAEKDKWYDHLDLLWQEILNENKKSKIQELFHSIGIEDGIDSLKNWIYFSSNALLLNKIFISDVLKIKLNEIGIDGELVDNEDKLEDIKKHALKWIIQLILNKINAKNFFYDNPVILVISLSCISEFIYLPPMEDFINYIKEKLNSLLIEEIDKNQNNKNKILNKLKNVYAIIIDTTNLNWFSDITKAKYEVNYIENTDNFYGVVYNSNLKEKFKKLLMKKIFKNIIPYSVDIPLGT